MRAQGADVPSILGGPVVTIPTPFGTFRVQVWTEGATGVEHMSLSAEHQSDDQGIPLVRLHSECLTGDVFGSYRCDCGEQLDQALALVNRKGGTIIYLRGQEGRGIGLADKVRAYALQEEGADTVEANEQLGLPVDARDYQAAAEILRSLNLDHIALLTNNPDKSNALAHHGITVERMVPSEVPVREENRRYLETKRDRMHHRLLLAADYIDAPLRQS
ncbi:GTP cyclohydrolase II [Arthrobacter roseus]|uniref:GTP cyclohydrolase II n=1 Tax=Arthrobacter roseus TaxID=136274 RepID=UPI0019649B42|nr:GTP cyclohydrolase II [Arthrobacter roseus]